MKRFFLFWVLLLFMFGCSKEEVSNDLVDDSHIVVDEIIEARLHSTNKVFNWQDVDLDVLWKAVKEGDNLVTVGYGGADDYDKVNDTRLQKQKETLLDDILRLEKEVLGKKTQMSDVLLTANKTLTYFDVFIFNKKTLEFIKSQQNIRYVEPANYIFKGKARKGSAKTSSLGCGTDAQTISSSDYSVVAPAAWVPWNFAHHNIQQAWNHSTGAGIGVGVIDTGISPDQDNFDSDFNSGQSSGRSVGKDGTYVSSWWPWADPDGPDDQCGHGTSMAGMVAAPRTGENVPVGVAYNANLFTVRGTNDVVLDGYSEQDGVADAITLLANRSNTKVISMSLGHIFSVGKISDAVKYAVNRKGKLFFSAGGTSTYYTSWYGVIFPASMSETVAVTGITDGSYYETCAVCHKGSEIDFTIVMQRDGDDSRTSVSLGFDGNTANYVGGSSIATATTAGIAALVWAQHPNWKNDRVLQKLKESAHLYPNRDGNFGWGTIDALQAVQ